MNDKNKELKTNSFHIRIKNDKFINLVNECMTVGKFNSFNDLFNTCLEVALPQIVETPLLESNTINTRLSKMENKLISKMDRELKSIKKEVTKQLILQQVGETLLSTLLQSFLFYMNTQGVKLDSNMIDDFINNLPEKFVSLKEFYAKELL